MPVFFRECLAPDKTTSDKGLSKEARMGPNATPGGLHSEELTNRPLRSELMCRAVHRIEGEQKPAEEDASRERNDFHNAKGHHAVVCFGTTRYNVSPDLGPYCKASESVQDLASVAESENEQGSDFHYLQLVNGDQSAKQQAHHQHQEIGCVFLHWI